MSKRRSSLLYGDDAADGGVAQDGAEGAATATNAAAVATTAAAPAPLPSAKKLRKSPRNLRTKPAEGEAAAATAEEQSAVETSQVDGFSFTKRPAGRGRRAARASKEQPQAPPLPSYPAPRGFDVDAVTIGRGYAAERAQGVFEQAIKHELEGVRAAYKDEHAYLADAATEACDRFVAVLKTHVTAAVAKAASTQPTFKPNPANEALKRQISGLERTLQSYRAEAEQWRVVEKQVSEGVQHAPHEPESEVELSDAQKKMLMGKIDVGALMASAATAASAVAESATAVDAAVSTASELHQRAQEEVSHVSSVTREASFANYESVDDPASLITSLTAESGVF